jgi:hypothetical protein
MPGKQLPAYVGVQRRTAPHAHVPALWLLGVLLVGAALAVGGGVELVGWGVVGALRHAPRIALLVGLYFAPGLALLRLLWPVGWPLLPLGRLGLALGVSTALPPLLLLLFELLQFPWGAWATWLYLLVSLAVAIGPRRIPALNSEALAVTRAAHALRQWKPDGADVALIVISIATLLVRLYTVYDLPTGLSDDSYQHTLMAQLLVDNRGLFNSWEPYAPLTTFTYHFGFHANAAFVHWVTGFDLARSVLVTGQIINAILAPLMFTLVVALRGPAWAGVWAALITGFVGLLPAFAVAWGRYTSLTGMVVQVAMIVCWIALAERGLALQQGSEVGGQGLGVRGWGLGAGGQGLGVGGQGSGATVEHPADRPPVLGWLRSAPRRAWRPLLLAALMLTAMLLTHYLVSVFAALFVAAYLLRLALERASWRSVVVLAALSALAGVLALALAAPWLLNLVDGFLVRNATAFVDGSVGTTRIAERTFLAPTMPLYGRSAVLAAALLGLCIAVWRREWRMALPGLWSILLLFCVVPQVVGLPGAGLIDQITAFGALSLTLPPLAGYALARVGSAIAARRPRLAGALAGVLILVAIGAGAYRQSRLIESTGEQVVTWADMAAMEWVRANTPADARFLANSTPGYGGALVFGTDAGWWIPLLTGRATNLPPMTYGSELSTRPDFARSVNRFSATLRDRPLTDLRPTLVDLTRPAAFQALREAGIGYVYSGAVSASGVRETDRIDTARLRGDARFRLVYDRGGVEIFQLQR